MRNVVDHVWVLLHPRLELVEAQLARVAQVALLERSLYRVVVGVTVHPSHLIFATRALGWRIATNVLGLRKKTLWEMVEESRELGLGYEVVPSQVVHVEDEAHLIVLRSAANLRQPDDIVVKIDETGHLLVKLKEEALAEESVHREALHERVLVDALSVGAVSHLLPGDSQHAQLLRVEPARRRLSCGMQLSRVHLLTGQRF